MRTVTRIHTLLGAGPPPEDAVSSLLDRLKERKMVQWALAYLAGAYGLVEVTDVMAGPFGISASAQRALIVLLAFGFLAALVLAWNHAEKGRQTATAAELLTLAVIAAGGVSASVVSYRSGDDGAQSSTPPGVESVLEGPVVAVFPFENLSAGAEGAAAVVRGIHGDILTNLSKVSGINVIARTSVTGYQRAGRTVRQIAEDFPMASAFLDGTIERVGGTIRINVWLVDALTEVEIWSQPFERVFEPESLSAVRSEIANNIADALGVTLAPAEQARLTRVATRDELAQELFMFGRDAEDRGDRADRQSWLTALDYYEQALERDSMYAEAHAARARMLHTSLLYVRGTPRTPEAFEDIRRTLERTLELDPDLAEGHRLTGEYHLWYTHDADRAAASFRRAHELDRDDPRTLRGLATMKLRAGNWEGARLDLYRAAELDPLEQQSRRLAGEVAYFMRRFDDAESHFRLAAVRFAPGYDSADPDPRFFPFIRMVYSAFIGIRLAADGDTDRALETLDDVIDRTAMTSRDVAIFLIPAPNQSVDFGLTMLGIDGLRARLGEDPDFPPLDVVPTRASLLWLSGEDPAEERRLWGMGGDRWSDDQYGGAGLRDRVFTTPQEELEVRSQVALMFARAGRTEHARLQMNRAREIAEDLINIEFRLKAEPRWAMTLVELGEYDRALDLLENMMARPSAISAGLLTVQPEWDPIREDPRFVALVGGG